MNLSNRAYLGLNEFERINWLPINDRVEQCISSMIFNCFNNLSPACMNDVTIQSKPYYCYRILWVKRVRIWSYSGPYFPVLGMNADQTNSEYGHFLRSDRC